MYSVVLIIILKHAKLTKELPTPAVVSSDISQLFRKQKITFEGVSTESNQNSECS